MTKDHLADLRASEPAKQIEMTTILELMRNAVRTKRIIISRGWESSGGGRVKIDSGPDDYRREWTAEYETAWQQLTDEERGLLADWRANLFRN
ncbi:MAG: hypothetical protein ACLP19_18245 [Xanthobacteraceae bacterium]